MSSSLVQLNCQRTDHRLFLRLDGAGDVKAPVQRLNMSLVALVDWRFASVAILPRAELATEFALLSHMLINGFFFNQGLDMVFLC